MNSLISVVDKASHNEVAVQGTDLTLHEPSVVRINGKRSDIKHIERDGDTLVLTMASGVVIKVHGFFAAHGPQQNDLVLQDDQHLWLMGVSENGQLTGAFAPIDSIEPLLLNEHFDLSTLAWVLGGLALLGGAAAAGGGGGGGHHDAPAQSPLTLAAPTVSVQTNTDGSVTVTGSAPAGSTVLLTYPDGSTGSVVAASDGHYSASSAPNQPSGTIAAHATDSSGHGSPTTSVGFVDTTAPGAPTMAVSANSDGTLTVSGSAEPGGTVTITYPDGTTSTVVADGSGHYSTSSSTVQTSGNVVATATDAAGNSSAPTTSAYSDSTAPLAPIQNVSANPDGTVTVTGSAEPHSTVIVTYPDGTTSSAVADASGVYSTSSTTVQTSGNVMAIATDVAGNASAPVNTAYVDSTAPLPPVAAVSSNPDNTLTVTGTAEPGSTVLVFFSSGPSASAMVDSSGHYSVTSLEPQTTGLVTVYAVDAAANSSAPTEVAYTDSTSPSMPTISVTVNPDDTLTVTGLAEPRSLVTVTYPDGTTTTTLADAAGNYSTTSTTPQTSGVVEATATDLAGNRSLPNDQNHLDTLAPEPPVVSIAANPNGTLTVSGSAEPGSTVTITYPDGSTSTVVADASGNYSTSSSTVQTSGNVVATATDAAGNTSAPVNTAYSDSTAPLAPIQNVSANPDGTLTVSGTAEPGSSVTVTYPDGSTSTVVADASGNYSTSSSTVQTSGNVVATATDAAGNTSAPATTAYSDSTAPLAPIQNVSANPDGTLTVSGTAEPGSSVTVTYPDGTTSTVVTDASGNYSTSSSTVQTSGNVVATATDAAGNTSAPATTAYSDSTAPLAPTQNVSANPDGTLTVTGTAEPGSTVTVTYPDGSTSSAVADAAGNYSTSSTTVQTSGDVLATATDAAGNTSAPTTSAYTDSTAPLAPTQNVSANPDGTLTVTGTAEPGSTVTVTYPDGSTSTALADAAGNYSTSSSTVQTSGNVVATASDAAGNTSAPVTTAYSDSTAPLAPIQNVSANPDGTLTVSGTAEPGSSVTVTYPDGTTSTVVTDASGNYSTSSSTVQTSGNVVATATDAAGNTSAPATTAYSDSTAPLAPTQNVSANPDGTLTVTGTAEPGSTVTVTYPDGSTSSAVADAAGNYSTSSTTVQTSGDVLATATDAAGNTSAPTTSAYSDSTAPLAPTQNVSANPDGTLSVTGTAEPGSTVTVTYPDGSTSSAVADAAGNYSTGSTTVQTSGDVLATATDAAGNTSAPTTSAYTDSTAPLAPIQNVSANPDGTLTVTGTAEPGSTVTVTYPDGSTSTALADAAGNYSTSSTTVQTSGNVLATATDAAGNTSAPATTAYTDSTAPLAPIQNVSANPDGTLTVTGTAEPGSTVTVTYPDGSTSTALADAAGNYSTGSTTVQTSGDVLATATDAAGNTSAPTTSAYSDSTAPLAPTQNVSANPDGTLSVTGTAEPGSTVTVTYPDGSTSTAVTDAAGNYSTGSTTVQTSGDVLATATDAAGNTSAPTTSAYTDSTAPLAPTQNVSANPDGTLAVTGNAEPGSTVTITYPDGSTSSVVADAAGHYSTVSGTAQISGNVQATATDAAGNTSAPTDSAYLNAFVPTATAAISAITDDTGSGANDYLTSDTTLVVSATLSGTLNASLGDKVQISVDGGLTWHDASLLSGNTYTYDNTGSSLASGSYLFAARVVNLAGNASTAGTQAVDIDTTAPSASATIAISAITNDTGASSSDFITGDNSLLFNGTLGSALAVGEGVQISLDGGATWQAAVVSGTTWSYDNSASTLADGNYNVQVRVIDDAGNVGQSASQALVVDTTAPAASATVTLVSISSDTGLSANDFITSDNTLVFNGGLGTPLSAGEGVRISLDGGSTWQAASVLGNSWSYDHSASVLADGSYNVQVQVIDTAGNIGQSSSQLVVVDTSAPAASATIAISAITSDTGTSSDFVTSDSTLVVSGTLGTPLPAGEGVQISLDGGSTWQVASVSGSTWSYDNSASALADGTYNLQARVIDTAGNVGQTASQSLVVDTTAPSASATIAISAITSDTGISNSDFITSDSTLVFNGTLGTSLAVGEGVQISLDGGSTWQVASVSGSTWSYDNSASTLADGSYTVQARVIDTAGNVGQTASQTLVVDSVAPAAGETISIASITRDTGASGSDFITSDHTLLYQGSLGAPLPSDERVQLSIDGGSTWQVASVTGTSWSYDGTGQSLADGNYTLQVRVVDLAGNVGQSASQAIVIDSTPPSAGETIAISAISSDTGASASDFITSDNTLVFNGTLGSALASGEGVQISLDGGASWQTAVVSGSTWSYDNSANVLADGTYNVQVQVIDMAGNVGQTASQNVLVDTTAPAASETIAISAITSDTGASSSDFVTSDHTLVFNGTLGTLLASGEGVQISLDGGATWQAAVVSGSTWSYDNSASSLADGTYALIARVVDTAGNIGQSASQSLLIDSTAPSASATVSAITTDTGTSSSDFITADNTLVISATLTGSLGAGETVQISLDGGLSWNTASLVSGSTYALDNTANVLADGSYTFEARVIDQAGNSGAVQSQAVLIDTTGPSTSNSLAIVSYSDNVAPQVGNFGDASSTNDSSPLLNGTVSGLNAGDRVQIYQGATLLGDASVTGGSWSYQLAALTEGSYSYHAVIVDAAGNSGTSSAPFSLTLDTSAPTVTVALSSISSDTGSSSSDYITSDNTLLVSGTLSAPLAVGETVLVGLDGGLNPVTATVTGTTWTLDLTGSVLADGTYHAQAWVLDAAGNKGPVATQDVVIDTTAPTATIAITSISQDTGSSAADYITGDNTLVFNGSLGSTLAAGEGVQISLDGGATWQAAVVSGSTWSYDNSASTLADSSYNVQVRVLDTAGNVGNLASQVVVVDASAPTTGNAVAITSYSDNVAPQVGNFGDASSTNDSTPLLNGSVSGLNSGDIVQVYQGSTLLGNATVSGSTWSYQLSTLVDGNYAYHAVITDAAGNQGSSSATFSLTVDTSAPSATETVAITAITSDTGVNSSDFITADNTLVFSGTLGAALASGEGVQVSLDGGTTWLTASVSGTTWSYDNSASVLADGNYSILARVVDAAGNVGQGTSHNLTVDTVAPAATISIVAISLDTGISANDYLTSDNTLVFSGNLSNNLGSGEGVQISLDGGTIWLDAQVSGSSWSYDNTANVLADGGYTVRVRVIDSAGNVGSSASQLMVVDSTAPSGNNLEINTVTSDTGLSGSDFVTSDTTLVFAGQLTAPLAANQRVEFSLDNGTTWNTAVAGSSSWSYDNTANSLVDGSYAIQARIIDVFGNVEQTTAETLVIDTTAPAASATIAFASISQDTGASNSDFNTSDPTLVFNGTLGTPLAAGEGVQISLDAGATWHNATVSGSTWSYDNTGNSLADGSYSLQARVVDIAGNVGQSASQTLVVDSSAPAATSAISAISNDTGASSSDFVTSDNTLLINATLTGILASGESVQISVDGGTTWHTASLLSGSTYQYDNTGTVLADGSYVLQTRVIDAAGNAGAVSSQNLSIDTSAPSATASITAITQDSGSSGSDFITSDHTLLVNATLSGTLGSGESVQISTDGGATWHNATALGGNLYQYDNTGTALADGSYSFQARVLDSAGNPGSVSSQTVQIDSSAPAGSIAITSVSPDTGTNGDFITGANRLSFSGTLGSVLASGEGVQVSLDGGSTWLTASVSTTTWSYDNSASILADGSYSVQARVIDAAGNTGTATSQTLVIDTSAPSATASISAISTDTGASSDFITSDGTLLITASLSGTLGSGESVQISTDGGASWHSAASIGGNLYQYDNTGTALADGSYSFQARVIDTAGNAGAFSTQAVQIDSSGPSTGNAVAIVNYTDNVAPQTGNFASGSSTNDSTPLLNGTVSGLNSGDTVQIFQGATLLGNATVSGANWNYQLGTLAEGSYSYHAVITDQAGNAGTSSANFTLSVDTTPPAASETISITAVTTDSGASDFITADNTLVISGTLGTALASGDSVQISLDGGSTWQVASVTGTTWSYDNTASVLADGSYSLQARVVDGAGNVGQSASQSLVIDTSAPATSIAISSITQDTGTSTSDFNTSDNTLVFNGTLGGLLALGEGVRISLNGGTTWSNASVSGATWSFDNSASILADGTYNLVAQVIDSAGNVGSSASQLLVVDTTAPTVSVTIGSVTSDTGASASDFITSDNTLVFQGALSAPLNSGEGVQFSIDGGVTYLIASVSGTTWSYDYTGTVLADGTYNLKARVFDGVGNIGLTANQTLLVDSSAPVQTIAISAITTDTGSSASDLVTSDKTLVFNGTLGAVLGANEGVQVSLDGGSTWQAASVTGSTWSFNNTGNSLADGTYSVQARVIDTAGNVGNLAIQTLVVDSTAPSATATISAITSDTGASASDFITNDQTLLVSASLTGTLGSGESLQISLDGGGTWQTAALLSGNTYQLDNTGNTLAAGSYSFQARVIDLAGNTGSVSSQAVVISTSGPAVTALALTAISTDTNAGLALGTASTTNSASNSDLVTRDTLLTLSGTYTGTLASGDLLQLSSDGGTTWNNTTYNTGTHTWSYVDASAHTSAVSYQLRTVSLAGTVGTVTATQTVTVDTTAPSQNLLMPTLGSAFDSGVVGDHVTTNTSMTFTSAQSRTGSAGDSVLLINDVNNDGIYSEGIDSVLASTTVAANGSWSLSASGLAVGSYHLGFMQVDAAGNRSRLSLTTEVDVVAANDHAAAASTGWGGANTAGSTENKGTAYTLGSNGLWTFYSNLSVYSSTGLATYSATSLATGATTTVNNVTFADYNRDGNIDILGVDNTFADGQQSWTYNGTTYTAFQVAGTAGSANVYNLHGTLVAYDKTGDGFTDLVYGEAFHSGDSQVPGGLNSQLLVNNSGTFTKDSNFVQTPNGVGVSSTTAQPYGEISGVDINNDGNVDLVFHQRNPAFAANNTLSVLNNNGTGALSVTFTLGGVFANPVDNSSTLSMTWADFNNDGYMDLFIGGGVTGSSGAAGTASESRIYTNNQGGGLNATPTWFGDTLVGGASLAVDWNRDGAMDVIELPDIAAAASPINLYTNNGTGTSWSTSTLATGINGVTGAVAVDYNWDGAQDLIYFRTGSVNAQWVQNTNSVQYGTSLHLRILDANGLTSYYGNTVQLYDASGQLVASQIINPQSGSNTNDSSSIVNFYGLSANQTYTAVLVRDLAGVSADVGGLVSLGGNTIENVNASWTGLATGAATNAYVLSAESGSNSAGGGFVGTGYNDTFFATADADTYNGSGGWSNARFATPTWSATGGEDVLDFKLAGSTGVTVNLNTATAQATGFNTATLVGIEGLRGASGNDQFTASTTAGVNNLFEGRGGNDGFTLGATGGHATLVYTLLNGSNPTGGNGSDTASGFVLGSVASTATADVIDLTGLLSGYSGTAYVYRDASSGSYVLDYASLGLNQYLQVTNDGSNSYVWVDLNGSGTFAASNLLLTLTGVVTDLPTLLAHNQLLLGSSSTGGQAVIVNSQSTVDTTPIVSGSISYALPSGAHMEVTVNGVTYSSATGAVVVDPNNNTWYVQVPGASALAVGSYEVSAVVVNSNAQVSLQDLTSSELSVVAAPSGTTTVLGETANISAVGMAVGDVNNDGLFDYFNATGIYFQSGTANATTNTFTGLNLYTEGTGAGQIGKVTAVQFLDFMRNGNQGLMTGQQNSSQGYYYFVNSGNGASFTLVNYNDVTAAWAGAQVGIDLNNDGYIDLVNGDKFAGDSGSYSLNNQNGTYTNYDAKSSADPASLLVNGNINQNVGAFDLNGDGRVDLIGQFWNGTWVGSVNDMVVLLTGAGGLSSALAATSLLGTHKRVSNVYFHENSLSATWYQAGAQTVNVADFNGDGKLDLFVGQTVSHGTADSIYTSDGAGNFTLATTLASSTLTGGVSLNTDWNGDGKLDIFEFADNGTSGTTLATQMSFEYWQNTTASTGAAPTFSRTLMSVSSVASATSIIGAVAADFNYDGSQDLVINANGNDVMVVNANSIAAGTSLHLKIVSPTGGNTYISQTVNLYDSTGTLVQTRVLNGQYGYGTNDSRGIVDFYGLDSGQTYTAVLVKGAIAGIDGGEGSISGSASLGIVGATINSTWTGLAPAAASHGYVLVADATNDSTTGTFIGTGYDDTFFAGAGTNTYNGSGGWETVSATPIWSSTGGTDIVDYKLAGSTALTIDLSNTGAQSTGFNTATFKNIEGIAGGSGNDTFTDSSGNNNFEGRGGNDTFNLTHGGHDTLVYHVLAGASANNTGGNGSDTVNGFKVGTWEGTPDTPRLDIHELLVGYSGDGSASYQNNVATLGAGAGNIGSFVQVTQSGADTVIAIDRDGGAGAYASTTLVTLNNVHTDLATLLANHQLTVV